MFLPILAIVALFILLIIITRCSGAGAHPATSVAAQNDSLNSWAIPDVMQKPNAGTTAKRWAFKKYSDTGSLADPDNDEIIVRVLQTDGTPITATLWKTDSMASNLDNPTDTTTFPTASGWRALERLGTGQYECYYGVANDATEEALTVEYGYTESSNLYIRAVSTSVRDLQDDIADLHTNMQKSEDQQEATVTLTTQNTWYDAFELDSSDYVYEGSVSIDFEASQSYEVRITTNKSTDGPNPVAAPVIDATHTKRVYRIEETPYVKVEIRCITASSKSADYRRNLSFRRNSGGAASS